MAGEANKGGGERSERWTALHFNKKGEHTGMAGFGEGERVGGKGYRCVVRCVVGKRGEVGFGDSLARTEKLKREFGDQTERARCLCFAPEPPNRSAQVRRKLK